MSGDSAESPTGEKVSFKELLDKFPCKSCSNDDILCISHVNSCSKVEEIKAWYSEFSDKLIEAAEDFHEHRMNRPIFGVPAIFGYKPSYENLEKEIEALEEWIDEEIKLGEKYFAGLRREGSP